MNEQFVGYSSQGPAALDPDKPDFCSITHFTGFSTSDDILSIFNEFQFLTGGASLHFTTAEVCPTSDRPAAYDQFSSSALACLTSTVSAPSENAAWISTRICRATPFLPWRCQSLARHSTPCNSIDLAPC